jgi:hypothetical protein
MRWLVEAVAQELAAMRRAEFTELDQASRVCARHSVSRCVGDLMTPTTGRQQVLGLRLGPSDPICQGCEIVCPEKRESAVLSVHEIPQFVDAAQDRRRYHIRVAQVMSPTYRLGGGVVVETLDRIGGRVRHLAFGNSRVSHSPTSTSAFRPAKTDSRQNSPACGASALVFTVRV